MSDRFFDVAPFPFEAWEEVGPEEFPAARLRCSVAWPFVANSKKNHRGLFHLEAVAVVRQSVEGAGDIMVAAHDDYSLTLDLLVDMCGDIPSTVTLGDLEYVITLTPFAE